MDLGSVMMRRSLIERAHLRFLPDGLLTDELFARDYFTVKKAMRYLKSKWGSKVLHQALLFHQ